MDELKKDEFKPRPLKLDVRTMEWRNGKVSWIEQQIHAGTEGLRDPHPLSPAVRKWYKDLPY